MDRAILSGKPQVITIVKGQYNLTNIVKINSIKSRINKGLIVSKIVKKAKVYKIHIVKAKNNNIKIGRA